MEINRGAGEHPHPNNHKKIQGHIQQVQDHPGKSRKAGGIQGGHWGSFLHDEEGRVGQDEGVSRDVIAVPVEASTPAGGFQCELLFDDFQGAAFVTRTGHILDVEEGLCADVPDSCCHHQRQQPPAEEGDTPAEGGVGQEEEGG